MTLPSLLTDTGTVPAAVAALRDRFRAVLPAVDPELDPADDPGVEVFDGPDSTRPFAPRAVTIAAAFEDDQNAVDYERTETGFGPSVTETLDVACSVYVGSGAVDETAVDEHRAAAGAILQAIDDGLRSDPTLGEVTASARITSAQWLQGNDGQGAGVIVGFVVSLVVLS